MRSSQDPLRLLARATVSRALMRGTLEKPDRCEECGFFPDTPTYIHGHHYKGYDKVNWLRVQWLCYPCHQESHRNPNKLRLNGGVGLKPSIRVETPKIEEKTPARGVYGQAKGVLEVPSPVKQDCALVEISFHSDPRVLALDDSKSFLFYLQAWITSVDMRRELLPDWFQAKDIGKRCFLSEEESNEALEKCIDKQLLYMSDGSIWVLGSQKKNSHITFKSMPLPSDPYEVTREVMDQFVEEWNLVAQEAGLSAVRKLTKDRVGKLKARLEEEPFNKKNRKALWYRIRTSEFLQGDKGWKLTFDFLTKNCQNANKILEGGYGGDEYWEGDG